MLYEIDWINVIEHFIIIWLIVIFFTYINKTSLPAKTKDYVQLAAILFILLTILHFMGFELYITFRLIEWATKFVLPWVALYWLVRLIKVFEKKS
ncbi:hypothetical protein [Metabacillus litoralis]|uniref:hypothetical protein n=1 Tax=Metabacillus litoralis TaxID=152268 RepID=UPI001CFD9253|nr:hypothetical protein [Metabacillus litoralis]